MMMTSSQPSDKLQSLDDEYFHFLFPRYKAIQSHSKGDNEDEMDLKTGDIVPSFVDNYHAVVDGYKRLKIAGKGNFRKVPAYKLEKIVKGLDVIF